MSTQDKVDCSGCYRSIDVSELAQEHTGCAWFSDGETVDTYCPHCEHENTLRINIHVSYEVLENKNPYQTDKDIDFDEEVF